MKRRVALSDGPTGGYRHFLASVPVNLLTLVLSLSFLLKPYLGALSSLAESLGTLLSI
jgi:hypothetical protein